MDSLDDPEGWESAGDFIGKDLAERQFGSSELRDGLTEKQRAVLDLLIQHKTSKEISRELGISPHTVDQRIMLARAKLNVSSRSEVAQAYRRLLEEERESAGSAIYERSIYGFSHVAPPANDAHSLFRDDVAERRPEAPTGDMRATMAAPAGDLSGPAYYHVLPEMFDGPNGTMLRLGAIAVIAVFLILIVLGGLAMYGQLAQMIDRT
ncbi:LuxR C-terminal-related transcriptional regulator [Novosphingobium cyanobacteriorum]|uniref:Helix-turn-helix transcriptional regulator n=1 Tax=Novosphingobium cyanobacteriorum TaxID=3024215 RepID=A0ABT6CQ24_9SPHN|nr:helix-turn-helix transcriptional regulator [Novosphingobium cyanobacteriorum]MDF8335205.1 helix-turn-helix transcriptional regulator [Novosphingobium cyanobacteriorum]